jgi:hypothetical protein
VGPRWPNIGSYDEELNHSRTAKRLRRLPLHGKAGGLALQVQPWSESLHAATMPSPRTSALVHAAVGPLRLSCETSQNVSSAGPSKRGAGWRRTARAAIRSSFSRPSRSGAGGDMRRDADDTPATSLRATAIGENTQGTAVGRTPPAPQVQLIDSSSRSQFCFTVYTR